MADKDDLLQALMGGMSAGPQPKSDAPQPTATAPQPTATAPQPTATAPQPTATAPQPTASAPQPTASAPVDAQGGAAPVSGAVYTEGANVKVGGKTYTVEKVVASGAEGDVYIVSDRRHRYALKLCHKGYTTNTKVMPALQMLKGKGYIADVIDFGPDYELLEYVPEGSASAAGIRGNAQAILAIAVKTAMSLDAMHKAGVIHKDVKPANILITNPASWDCVLCDFGIADLLNNRGTVTTLQVRTPIYAAPEVYGKGNTIFKEGKTYCELTPKADFYSLGMTILSLWMGEGAFSAAEDELGMDKTKGRIAPPPDMPDPLAKICRGLLIKDPEKRWDLGEITGTIEGKDFPVEEDEIIEDLNITFNATKHLTANTPEELVVCMIKDGDLATKYLYRGQIERWLKPYPELAMEIHDIVETRFPQDQETGLMAAIYTLDPSFPFIMIGAAKDSGEEITRRAVTLKDVSDFCNMAVPTAQTALELCSDIFREWVRVRSSELADALLPSANTSDVFMQRVQTIDPLSDINLCNDPSSPDYAMTQEAIGRLLNKVYNIFWNVCGGQVGKVAEIWNEASNAPLNRQIPSATVVNIAVNFLAPEDYHFVTNFFDSKGDRFESQRTWFVYSTDRNSDDYIKKAGPKDDAFRAQAAWMKVIKGFRATPEYVFADGSVATDLKGVFSHSRKELKDEYLNRGLRGFLAVHHQEDPDADLRTMFAYEKLLFEYLEDIRRIDDDITPVRRFDQARGNADRILSSGKSRVRSLSVSSVLQRVLTILFALIPMLVLLAILVFSIIEHPVLDVSAINSKGSFVWVLGLVIAALVYIGGDYDGCVVPIILGVVSSILLVVIVKFLGALILYLFAAAVLAAIIFFSIKTIFNVSPYARQARKFTKPGFDEKVLEPLYYAFGDDTSFDSSLNGAFNDNDIRVWKEDVRVRRIYMLIFIGVAWLFLALSLFVPKSERFERYSAPVVEWVGSKVPALAKTEPVIAVASLKPGDKGEYVVALQQFLRSHGYTKNAPDGDYGPGTKKVVMAFQQANGLDVTGIADKKTVKKINKICSQEQKAAAKEAKKASAGGQTEKK
ncbi:MAG: peptidoglycan-binding protein [Bacteroidales bacterium]|nr:peptidoglycan-binding protein [Bacteroidales bacterium]